MGLLSLKLYNYRFSFESVAYVKSVILPAMNVWQETNTLSTYVSGHDITPSLIAHCKKI